MLFCVCFTIQLWKDLAYLRKICTLSTDLTVNLIPYSQFVLRYQSWDLVSPYFGLPKLILLKFRGKDLAKIFCRLL